MRKNIQELTTEQTDLELKDLNKYYGSENYFNVMNTNVTDGIYYIMKNGYSWLVTDFLVVAKSDNFKIKDESFISVKLKLKDDTAKMIVTDGNDKILYTQDYEYTNVKREVTLFYIDNVLLLSSEY